MAFTQIYSALEQGVVDGQENPYGNVTAQKYFEVQKYLTNTGHVYNASPFLVSKKFWDTLSDKEKEIVKKAANEARDYQRQLSDKEDQDGIALLKSKGMKITDLNPGEKEKAVQLLQPIYKEVSKIIGGDLVERLLQAGK
jgi:TRAP-type C4-dicarboxylate transport system substrate-binding protein